MFLSDMESGQSGKVVCFHGGHRMVARLESMGVRIGKTVKKLSNMPGRGPAVVQVEGTQGAAGVGMARRIEVRLERDGDKETEGESDV